jgi:uncharacterized protein YPO0396
MKKSILKLTAILFTASLLVTSCNTPAEKVEAAKEKVANATDELNNANQIYLSDVETYRIETRDKINANNESISNFNARIESEKKEVKADYKKKIAELEAKNGDMKKRMEEYRSDSKENWESFKSEFNHDMDELGKALKDLTVNNKK